VFLSPTSAGASTTGLVGVSCVGTSTSLGAEFCAAVDSNGDAYTYADNAGTPNWIEHSTSASSFSGVSCVNDSFCEAVGTVGTTNGYVFTWSGSSPSWSSGVRQDTTGDVLNAISCTSMSFCVGVDNGGNAVTFNGTTWTTAGTGDSSGLQAVSCMSSNFCMAVDSAGSSMKYSSETWTAKSVPSVPAGYGLVSISCITKSGSNSCLAGDGEYNAHKFSGSSWTWLGNPFGYEISGISCVVLYNSLSDVVCGGVDVYGQTLLYSGSSWGDGYDRDPGEQLQAISCVPINSAINDGNTDSCAAVDNDTLAWS
jgi:hypothetical protein